jgi:hypothetical protein
MLVSGQLHAPAALPQGKSPWYPLERRLDGPQSRFRDGGEEKIPSPCRDSNPLPHHHPARSPALYHWDQYKQESHSTHQWMIRSGKEIAMILQSSIRGSLFPWAGRRLAGPQLSLHLRLFTDLYIRLKSFPISTDVTHFTTHKSFLEFIYFINTTMKRSGTEGIKMCFFIPC